MAKKERSSDPSVEKERLRFAQSANRVAAVVSVIRDAVKYGGLGFIAWQVQLAIASIAGKETSFSAVLNAVIKFDASKYGAFLVAAIVGVDNYRQRRLRKEEVRELSAKVKEYELIIDPMRSSSGLTVDGTPPAKRLSAKGEKNEP